MLSTWVSIASIAASAVAVIGLLGRWIAKVEQHLRRQDEHLQRQDATMAKVLPVYGDHE